ncbi:tyrosine-type recombinase/integrase [Candidatus Uabimicrobium sp. HlEnr_7]|uniref:tyrosine-type recombinase/integrase n=1 Tax=Candidatus Uabimicrobium helgolandensis TaxID=3095367 RepID=UPI003556117B
MANAFTDNGYHIIHFYYKKRQYRNRTKNCNRVKEAQEYTNDLIYAIKKDLIEIPLNMNIDNFIWSKIEMKFPEFKKDNGYAKTNGKNFLELLEEYHVTLELGKQALSTKKTQIIHMRHLKKYLKDNCYSNVQITNLPEYFFEDYKQQRENTGVCENTALKELKTFKYILKEYDEVIAKKLFKRMKIYRKPNIPNFLSHQQAIQALKASDLDEKKTREIKRYRYFNIDETNEIIALAKNSYIYPIVVTVATTGARRGELARLRWEDLNFATREITVYSKKQSRQYNEVSRVIPMDKYLYSLLLKNRKKQNGCYVFGDAKNQPLSVDKLSKDFKKLLAGTKFEGIGFHSFRHSLSSNLYRKKVDQRATDDILGHNTEEAARRYRHTFPQQNGDVLENYLGRI